MIRRLDTDVFDREVRSLLAAARWGAAELEQVLGTTARIDLADAGSWLREWTAAGGDAWAAARQEGQPGSFLHAATYYGAALALIDESDGLVDETVLWTRQRECWEHAVSEMGGERLEIPYETSAMPGFFISGGDGRRPVVTVNPGGRMVTSESWSHVGAAAHARGFHWLVFDGPGQQESRRRGLSLSLDWTSVVAPVIDTLCLRPDVDPSSIAIVGLEYGGFEIASALTNQRRVSAALLVPGILDASVAWIDLLPEGARAALLDGDPDLFEQELHLAALFAPELTDRLRRAARWFDSGDLSLYELYTKICGSRLGAEVDRITTPTTIYEPTAGSCWAGQASELVSRLGPNATLTRGQSRDEVVLRWLDQLPPIPKETIKLKASAGNLRS